MVDFARLSKELYERSTPEERARIDAYHEREDRLNQTRRPINASFVRSAWNAKWNPGKSKMDYIKTPVRTWTEDINMRIEDRLGLKEEEYEVLNFIGGPTGFESYRLDQDFVDVLEDIVRNELVDESQFRGRFTICAGGGNYDECGVSATDVLDYLREVRPEFFQDRTQDMGILAPAC